MLLFRPPLCGVELCRGLVCLTPLLSPWLGLFLAFRPIFEKEKQRGEELRREEETLEEKQIHSTTDEEKRGNIHTK